MAGQGFASMDKKRFKEVTSKGGKTAQANGKTHKWTQEEARAAQLKSMAARKAKQLNEQE